MLEFKRLCDAFEKLSVTERSILLTEKSVMIFERLCSISLPEIDPTSVLAGFIIGSSVSDGKINEKEYLMIYPSLIKIFGDDFDFNAIKNTFSHNRNVTKVISRYTEDLLNILAILDDKLKWDIIMLCLCAVSIDGKITLKEKQYIRRLCETGT